MFRFFVICIWIQISAEVDTVIDNYPIHVTDIIHSRECTTIHENIAENVNAISHNNYNIFLKIRNNNFINL